MRRSTHVVAVTAMVGGLLAITPQASAATFEVDKLTDAAGEACDSEVGDDCSLRSAIQLANATAGADEIVLSLPGPYLLTINEAEESAAVDAATRDLDVTSEITIVGGGNVVDATAIDDRAFQVTADGDLTGTGLSVTGGAAAGTPSGTGGASGGGYLNAGTLTLDGGAVTDNTAERAGGGIEASAGSTTTLTDVDLSDNETGPTPGNGGGLHITGAGTVDVVDSTVSGNTATAEGGGLWNSAAATLTVTGTDIDSNVASGAEATNGGGGIYNDGGQVTVSDSVVVENTADGEAGSGGGILNASGTLDVTGTEILGNSSERAGGGIEAAIRPEVQDPPAPAGGPSTTVLTDVDLSGNSTGGAPGNGGGLHITGAGTVDVVDSFVDENTATAEGGGLWNSAAATMTVTSTELGGNIASGDEATNGGGGLYNDGGEVTVSDSVVVANTADGEAGSGGGILNVSGTLDVSDSALIVNSANRAGGGVEAAQAVDAEGVVTGDPSTTTLARVDLVANDAGADPGNGGALHITGAGTVDVDESEVLDNSAGNEGGGLWNSGAATMSVTDSTFAGNEANGEDDGAGGGALYNDGGTLDALNITVTDNVAEGDGGGVLSVGGEVALVHATVTDNSTGVAGPVDLRNSVVAGNDGDDCIGDVTSSGGNVTGDDCDIAGPGDRTDVDDAQLGELADNGGPTLTRLPEAGSPVIDAARAEGSTSADQRGSVRPTDGDGNGSSVPDAGAVEAAARAVPPGDGGGGGGGGGGMPTSPPAKPVTAQPTFTG